MAAVKRHIKREYAECIARSEQTEDGAARNYHLGAAAVYFEMFKMLFYSDGEMTDGLLRQLISLKDNE